MDTGNVVVGNKGSGSLLIAGSGQNGPYGTASVDGAVQIGIHGGSGSVSLRGETLSVTGGTVLGPSSADTIDVLAGDWNSSGHSIRLLAARAGQAGGTLSLTQNSSLEAGDLVVGQGDNVQAYGGAAFTLLASNGFAGAIGGRLVLGQESSLFALGNLSVAHSYFDGGTGGLALEGGSATLVTISGYALSVVDQGVTTVGFGSTLTSEDSVLVASQGALIVQGGTATAESRTVALNIAAAGTVFVQAGELNTYGELVIGDSDRRAGEMNVAAR